MIKSLLNFIIFGAIMIGLMFLICVCFSCNFNIITALGIYLVIVFIKLVLAIIVN